jgi:hypothetical protein
LELTSEWATQQLSSLSELLANHQEKLLLVRNELRKLFPDKLVASAKEVREGVLFAIRGAANPFNLLADSPLQLSCAYRHMVYTLFRADGLQVLG